MSKIAILILAAGGSSRMGKVKQLLPYKHTTLLGWAIEQALESEADEVFCVLGANAEKIEKSVRHYDTNTILNRNYSDGLSSSIVTGIRELNDYDAILVMLADQPLVTTSYLNDLINLYRTYPDMIVASNYGASNGVPAVFPENYFSQLLKLKGDKGAKEFLNDTSYEVLSLNIGEKLIDVDTEEDYKKLKK